MEATDLTEASLVQQVVAAEQARLGAGPPAAEQAG